MSRRIVIFYSELAGYVLACADALAVQRDADVHLVHWPVNSEAPFQLPDNPRIRLTDRSTLDQPALERLLSSESPDAIVVSGWMDRAYVRAVRSWTGKIPVILGMDNHWTGSLKQRIASRFSYWLLKRSFNRIWIPGDPQREFALRLGYSPAEMRMGWYCADVERFLRVERSPASTNPRLLYVGRYVPQKGIDMLWEAFAAFRQNFPEWELHCIGTGSEWDRRSTAAGIFHHGFRQPDQLLPFISQASAFVMPSLHEPWGVVLQEMAAAGLPLLTSDAVGAATQFVRDGCNGFVFPAGDTSALLSVFQKLAAMPSDEVSQLGERSRVLAGSWTPCDWADRLMSFLN